MTITILIVNWNSKNYLRRCLETVHSTCASLSPQVVVVDAGSYDGSGEMIAAEFPEVEFAQCCDNVGFARANNAGFERVRGDALVLLNPDTELMPGALCLLLDELYRLPKAGILGPRIVNSDGSLQTSCVRSFPTPLNQALDSERLRRLFPSIGLWGTWRAFQSKAPVEVEALSGACMLIMSETFRQVGGFSNEFFMYGEDLDLCYKVRRLGLRQYYIPAATVLHHGGKSSAQQFKKYCVVLMRAADHKVIRKWLGLGAATRYRFLMGLSALLRLMLLLPAVPVGGKRTRSRRLQSLQKWYAILRWSFGLEPWADRYGLDSSALSRDNNPGRAQPTRFQRRFYRL